MMKKITAALVGLLMIASMTACGAEPTDGHDTASTTTTTSKPVTVQTESVNTPVYVDDSDEMRSPNVTYFVKKTQPVDISYFEDVVFVGDSVSLKLTNYQNYTGCLGDAEFLTSGSLGVANSMWDLNEPEAVHPSFRGEKVTVADGIARSGCSKVYLMLGINDVGLYGVEGTFENFKTLTAKILEKSPNVTLYIQSVTPLYEDYYNVTNARVNEYNALISEYCREKGWYFVDVASVLRDENGKLPRDYCSDPDNMGIHFTDIACQKWVEYLFSHTGQ